MAMEHHKKSRIRWYRVTRGRFDFIVRGIQHAGFAPWARVTDSVGKHPIRNPWPAGSRIEIDYLDRWKWNADGSGQIKGLSGQGDLSLLFSGLVTRMPPGGVPNSSKTDKSICE